MTDLQREILIELLNNTIEVGVVEVSEGYYELNNIPTEKDLAVVKDELCKLRDNCISKLDK